MRKKLFMCLLLTGITMMMLAQDAVAIHQKNGTVITFAFMEKPKVTYSGSDLVLTTTKTSVTYPVYLLQKIVFDINWDELTGIEKTEVKADAQFRFNGTSLLVSGEVPGSTLSIYDMKGVLVGQYGLDDSGCTAISLGHLAEGIYLVRTKSFTFKFHKS